jgi:hypothetical protein
MKIKFGGYEGDWNPWDAAPFYLGAALHSDRNDSLLTPVGEAPKLKRNRLSRYVDYWGMHAYNIPAILLILQQCSK